MTLGQISARDDFSQADRREQAGLPPRMPLPADAGLGLGRDQGRRRARRDRAALFSLLVARDLQHGAGPARPGGHHDADPGRDRRRAEDGQEPGQLHRRRRGPRRPVRQGDEPPRRPDAAILHPPDRPPARRGRPPPRPRRQPARRQGSPRPGRSSPSTTATRRPEGAAETFRKRAQGLDQEIRAANRGYGACWGRIRRCAPAILLKALGLAGSTSEGIRLVEQGAVKIGPDRVPLPRDRNARLEVASGLMVTVGSGNKAKSVEVEVVEGS